MFVWQNKLGVWALDTALNRSFKRKTLRISGQTRTCKYISTVVRIHGTLNKTLQRNR